MKNELEFEFKKAGNNTEVFRAVKEWMQIFAIISSWLGLVFYVIQVVKKSGSAWTLSAFAIGFAFTIFILPFYCKEKKNRKRMNELGKELYGG